MKQYIGTKIINAKPMTRAQWCEFRGWSLPSDENGADEGYMVEYTDGGKPNHPDFTGYISWSPKEQFDNAYIDVGNTSGFLPHQQRVMAEAAELRNKLGKLNAFISSQMFSTLPAVEQGRLIAQFGFMECYHKALLSRIAAFA